MEDQINELFLLLQNKDHYAVDLLGLDFVLSLTSNEENLKFLNDSSRLCILFSFLKSSKPELAIKSALILINISADEDGTKGIIKMCDDLKRGVIVTENVHDSNPIKTILELIMNPECKTADLCCKILSNLTRWMDTIEKVITLIQESGVKFEDLINIFVKVKYNVKGNTLDHLGSVIGHLCQSPTFSSYILDKEKFIVQKILPFTEYRESQVKRRAAAVALKNCCFNIEHHEWLLSDEVDILSALLLPLTGNTQFDDDDNDKFPFALQYLPNDKERESDPDIRCILLEALTQLCALRKSRTYLRAKNINVLIIDLHKWSKTQDRKTMESCGNLLEILLRDETDIECDNLKEVSVPHNFDPTSVTTLIDMGNVKAGGWIKM